MDQVITVGLDLAKSVFQLHGVTASGGVDLQGRSSLLAPDAGGRRDGGDQARAAISGASPLAHTAPGPSKRQGRGGRPCEQNRPNRLGDDDDR